MHRKGLPREGGLARAKVVATERLAGFFQEKGVAFVDAPVSGGVIGAEQGTLSVMAAGDRQAFDTVEPLLCALGRNVFYVGARPGMGQAMKLVNNMLAATNAVAAFETLVMGAKVGLDTQVMLDVINVSSGRNSATLDRVPQCVLPRTFPMRFARGGHDDWDDGSGRLAALAPLRTDVLSGDLRLFYLLWLTAVQDEFVPEDEVEPLPGIAPLTGALEGFAEFFGIDPDLVQAAAELGADDAPISRDDLRDALAAIPEREKVELLLRAVDGDLYVGAELRSTRKTRHCHTPLCRALRMRAQEIREARDRAEAERREAERRRQAAEAEKARRARLKVLKQRGRQRLARDRARDRTRNPAGYDQAVSLLCDLQALAVEEGNQDDFSQRLASICARHEKMGKFIERLSKLGRDLDERRARSFQDCGA